MVQYTNRGVIKISFTTQFADACLFFRRFAWVIDPPLRNFRVACQIFRRRSYISVKGEYDDKHETEARDLGRGCVRTVGRSAEARRTPYTARRTTNPLRWHTAFYGIIQMFFRGGMNVLSL